MLKKHLVSDIYITHKPGLFATVIECEYSANIFGENVSKKKECFIIPNIFGKVEHETDLDLLYGKNSSKLGWIATDTFLTDEKYNGRFKNLDEQFDKLANSPKGTITQAIIIFNKAYNVEELPNVLKDIGDVKLEYCWFTVETGFPEIYNEYKESNSLCLFITHPVGFSVFTPENISTNSYFDFRRDMYYRGLEFDTLVKYPAELFEGDKNSKPYYFVSKIDDINKEKAKIYFKEKSIPISELRK